MPRDSPASIRQATTITSPSQRRHRSDVVSIRWLTWVRHECPGSGTLNPELPVSEPFEDARLSVLTDGVPREMLAVHRNVDASRQNLGERERAPEIEETVGAAERIRHHRAGEDHSLVADDLSHRASSLHHRVGAVGDHDASLRTLRTAPRDACPVLVGHLETVDHHQRLDRRLHARTAKTQHFGQVRAVERELSADFVVPLVERAAGDDDANHGSTRGMNARIASSPAEPINFTYEYCVLTFV